MSRSSPSPLGFQGLHTIPLPGWRAGDAGFSTLLRAIEAVGIDGARFVTPERRGGAQSVMPLLTVEPRIRAAVLAGGGVFLLGTPSAEEPGYSFPSRFVQRSSQSSTVSCHSTLLAGLSTQWFSSGK